MAINWKGLGGKFGKQLINYRFWLCFLVLPIVIIYLLVIVGCMFSKSFIPNLHLVAIGGLQSPNKIHIGFFGLCAVTEQGEPIICQNTRFPDLTAEFNATTSEDLRDRAILLQAWTFYPILVVSLIIFAIASVMFVAFRWWFMHKSTDVKCKSNKVLSATIIVLWYTAASAAAMTLGVDMAAGGMAAAAAKEDGNKLTVEEGWTVVILLSVVVALSVLYNFGLMFYLWQSRRDKRNGPIVNFEN